MLTSGSHSHSKLDSQSRQRHSDNPDSAAMHHSSSQHHAANIVPLKEVLSSSSSSGASSVDSKHRKMKLRRHDPIKHVSLFGVDLSRFSPAVQATILIALILCGFISIGYVEEGFKFEFKEFSYGWFMTAVELAIFSLFAMTERLFKGLAAVTSAVYLASASTVSLAAASEHESLIAPSAGARADDKASSDGSNWAAIQRLFGVNWLRVIFEAQMSMKYHLVVAAAMMCSRALTNIALLLLNYPTQVMLRGNLSE